MTISVTKPSINLREKLNELDQKQGIKGTELMRAETTQEVRNAIGAGRKNLIINGAMQVAQRATQVTGVTSDGYKTVDRFSMAFNSFGTHTVEQSTDSPSGFYNSLKITCTTANTPSHGDYVFFRAPLEGQDFTHLNFGSSDAKQLTLSFWVKSNKTGTIGQECQMSGSIERTADVTINQADTWEYKTVLIPANTVNAISADNSTGFSVWFWLNSGTGYKGTPNPTWGTYSTGRAGTVTLKYGESVDDYVAITGVQLEVGSQATDFEHRSYGEELALCQRYYTQVFIGIQAGKANGTTGMGVPLSVPVSMRTTPTVSLSSSINFSRYNDSSSATNTATGVGVSGSNDLNSTFYLNFTGLSGLTDNRGWTIQSSASVYFDAEL